MYTEQCTANRQVKNLRAVCLTDEGVNPRQARSLPVL